MTKKNSTWLRLLLYQPLDHTPHAINHIMTRNGALTSILGIRRVRSTMPRAGNRPCMQYSLSTRPIVPRQMISMDVCRGRGKVQEWLILLLICRTFEAILT